MGGDGHRHQVLAAAAQPDAEAVGIVAVAAGHHVQAGLGGTLAEAGHGSLPVHAERAVVLFAHHDFGAVHEGAADDRMDRLRAHPGALAQHIVADGVEGGTVHHAFIHIMAQRLEFRIDLLPERLIRDHPLEIVADGREGLFRVRALIQRKFQRVDEQLAHLVLGFHHQDGILLRKAAHILCRRLRQPENTGNHSSMSFTTDKDSTFFRHGARRRDYFSSSKIFSISRHLSVEGAAGSQPWNWAT